MNKTYYYLNEARDVLGPVSAETLKELQKVGVLGVTAQICEQGTETWLQFSDVFPDEIPSSKAVGGVTDDTQVCREGSEDWINLAAVAENTGSAKSPAATTLSFSCPHCEQHIAASAEQSGLSTQCPKCGGDIQVPNFGQEQMPAPQVRQKLPTGHQKKSGKRALIYGAAGLLSILVILAVVLVINSRSGDKPGTEQAGQTDAPEQTVEDASAGKQTGMDSAAGSDLKKWRIAGVHLGMSKDQVLNVLRESLDSTVSLEKTGVSNDDLQIYQPKTLSKDVLLKQQLKNSKFSFSRDGHLNSIVIDLEIIKKISNLEALETKEFAQQVIRQYGLPQLDIDQVRPGFSDESHTVYEAFVPFGSKNIVVSITDIHGQNVFSERRLKVALVEPLSFGPKGSLFGLRFGMNKKQVEDILKSILGPQIELKTSTNVENQELPESLAAYDIHGGKSTLGTSYMSFVVFNKSGELEEISFNADELERLTSCNSYHASNFGRVFMQHFGITKMQKKQAGDSINYKYNEDGTMLMFTDSFSEGYSIYVLTRDNKAKF